MQTTTSQTDSFLANSHNKSRLIVMLNGLLNDVGIQTIQAPADADALIVSTALSVAESSKTVIVVGADTDLLVMLVALSALTWTYTCYALGTFSHYIAWMTFGYIARCDTVSALYRIGKRKPYNVGVLHIKREYGMLNLFLNSDSTHKEIQRAGESFLLEAIWCI